MDLRTKEVVRYLGYGRCAVDEKTLQEIPRMLEMVERHAIKKSTYHIYTLPSSAENTIKSKKLKVNLKDCKEVILMAATLGVAIDREIKKYQLVDLAKAVILQACATVVLEEYCDELQKDIAAQLRKQGKYMRPRFSPGYGDFSMKHQKDLLAILDAAKKTGIMMTDSYMLTPTKSITAVIGVCDFETNCDLNGCEACKKADCIYKRS